MPSVNLPQSVLSHAHTHKLPVPWEMNGDSWASTAIQNWLLAHAGTGTGIPESRVYKGKKTVKINLPGAVDAALQAEANSRSKNIGKDMTRAIVVSALLSHTP